MGNEVTQANRIRLLVMSADKTKKAEVTLPSQMTVGDLVAACKKNWALPTSDDFAIRDTRRNIQLNYKDTLASAGLVDGVELEVYPLLEAGIEN